MKLKHELLAYFYLTMQRLNFFLLRLGTRQHTSGLTKTRWSFAKVTAKESQARLAAATQQTDRNLAQLGVYVCGSPADGLPATMLATLHTFVTAFDQSMGFITCQAL